MDAMTEPRVFMLYTGGLRDYRGLLAQCVADGYAGYSFGKD